jgi:protein-tyrosine phosphatase
MIRFLPMIDLHCHVLPGVDDGPRDLPASLALARKLEEIGFTRVCATPHFPWMNRIVGADELRRIREEVSAYLRENGVALTIIAGAEHHSQVVFELIQGDQLVAYPRGDTFLMEFPFSGLPPRYKDLLFRIQVKGKKPVIAHVERYPEVQDDPGVVESMREQGAYILINLSSLAGAWSRPAQQVARELLTSGLVDAASSDLHLADEAGYVAEGLSILKDLVGPAGVPRLLEDIPREILGL